MRRAAMVIVFPGDWIPRAMIRHWPRSSNTVAVMSSSMSTNLGYGIVVAIVAAALFALFLLRRLLGQ